MTNRRNDRTMIYVAMGALITMALLFAGYSYNTSATMDRSAASAGSSTASKAANTLQDKAADRPAGAPSLNNS